LSSTHLDNLHAFANLSSDADHDAARAALLAGPAGAHGHHRRHHRHCRNEGSPPPLPSPSNYGLLSARIDGDKAHSPVHSPRRDASPKVHPLAFLAE
jgi:hypothetical protein